MTRAPGSSIKDILVIIDNGGERRAAVLAADLARRLRAHLTGVALAFDPIIPVYTVAAPIPTDFIVAAHEQGIADAETAIAALKAIGDTAGIAVEARLAQSITGDGFMSVMESAVLTDLAVVGQEDPARPEPMREAMIEALLFQAGVPTLLVPYSAAPPLAMNRVAVAWNGSSQAARAVRAALPLLAAANEVVVVMVDESQAPGEEPGADIGAYLARHDLDVTVRVIAKAVGGAGKALLSFAGEEKVDWLVMGAYGHSRLREFLLGGVTRHVIANATLPVLMAH